MFVYKHTHNLFKLDNYNNKQNYHHNIKFNKKKFIMNYSLFLWLW